MSEQRCLLSEHPQKMHVTLLSIFRRVKTVLSSRKSRVFSRTRFQYPLSALMCCALTLPSSLCVTPRTCRMQQVQVHGATSYRHTPAGPCQCRSSRRAPRCCPSPWAQHQPKSQPAPDAKDADGSLVRTPGGGDPAGGDPGGCIAAAHLFLCLLMWSLRCCNGCRRCLPEAWAALAAPVVSLPGGAEPPRVRAAAAAVAEAASAVLG